MTTKEKVVQAVQALPNDASIEDAMERLFLLAKVEKGLQQADAGELIPHEKVKERMAQVRWTTPFASP
jgi:predicted transcriptional regulator